MSESVPGFEASNWYGFSFPASTAALTIAKLNVEARKAVYSNDVVDLLKRDGADVLGSNPAELAAYFKREISKYGAIIRDAGIKPEQLWKSVAIHTRP